MVGARFPPFNGPLNLLGNRRIGILRTHTYEPLFLPISLAENIWLRIQGPLKQKATVANHTEEEGTSAARRDDMGGDATQAGEASRLPVAGCHGCYLRYIRRRHLCRLRGAMSNQDFG